MWYPFNGDFQPDKARAEMIGILAWEVMRYQNFNCRIFLGPFDVQTGKFHYQSDHSTWGALIPHRCRPLSCSLRPFDFGHSLTLCFYYLLDRWGSGNTVYRGQDNASLQHDVEHPYESPDNATRAAAAAAGAPGALM